MIEYLQKLIESRKSGRSYPCLFDESSIRSIFHMLDAADSGYISLEKYTQGSFSNHLLVFFEIFRPVRVFIRHPFIPFSFFFTGMHTFLLS